jgi:MFS family permease
VIGRFLPGKLAPLFAGELAVFASIYFLLTTAPLYILALGGSRSDVGLLTGAGSLSIFAAAPLAGRAVDRLGRRPLLLGSLIALASGLLGIACSGSPVWLVGPLVVCYASFSAHQTASRTLVLDVIPVETRGQGLAAFMVAPNLAIAISPAIGLALWHGVGRRAPFLAAVLLCSLALVLVWRAIRDLPASAPEHTSATPREWIVREALFPSAVQLLLSTSYMSSISFLSVAGEARGIEGYAWFFSAYALAVVGVRLVTGRVSDLYGRAVVLIPALLSQAVGVWIVGAAQSTAALAVAAVAFGTGWGAAYPMLTTLVADRVEPARRGSAMGVLAAANSAGSTAGIALVGFLSDAAGFERAFQTTSVLAALGAGIAAIGLRASGQLGFGRVVP